MPWFQDYEPEPYDDEFAGGSGIGCNAPDFDPEMRAEKIRQGKCMHCKDTFRLGDHVVRGVARCGCGAAQLIAIGLSGMQSNRWTLSTFVRRAA